MSAPVTTVIPWHWPADVVEFADQQQVRQYLEPLLEATRRVFPTAHSIKVSLQVDPEIPDDWHIDFDIQGAAADVPQFVETQHQWTRELYGVCPAPLVCIFRLGIHLVPS